VAVAGDGVEHVERAHITVFEGGDSKHVGFAILSLDPQFRHLIGPTLSFTGSGKIAKPTCLQSQYSNFLRLRLLSSSSPCGFREKCHGHAPGRF
jgi:hypothetical protein